MKAPNGGAISVWASSGVTTSTTQQPLVLEFYRQLFSNPTLTVGQAAARAKAAAPASTRHTWVLLGDPVTKLK